MLFRSVKPGAIAVGYTSRPIDEKTDTAFGMTHGIGSRRILLREGKPLKEPQRVEVLTQYLAKVLGAVGTPDPGSAMRAKLDDDYIFAASAVLRLDPLNALALAIWAEELRREPDVDVAGLSVVNRVRLARVYKALLKAAPGDAQAIAYLNDLDRDFAKELDPKGKPARPELNREVRDAHVRIIVKAITDRAKQNAALGTAALTGDELTASYIRAAAEAAVTKDGPEAVSAFLLALGIALDDANALADDALTSAAVKSVETPEERKSRLAVLGNPTLANRRDLCRRFALGCASGELLSRESAESAAVGRGLRELRKPVGLCFPAVAAEFAGVAFAKAARSDPDVLRDVIQKFPAADYLPPLKGLRDGLSAEKFEELYGGTTDERFVAVLSEIRTRIKSLKAYR